MRFSLFVFTIALVLLPKQVSALPNVSALHHVVDAKSELHHKVFWYRDRRYVRSWRYDRRGRYRYRAVPRRVLGWRRVYLYRYRGNYRPSVLGFRRFRYDPVARYNGTQ